MVFSIKKIKELKDKQPPTDTSLVTPYLNARREWNERYGSYIIDARNWRIAAFLFGATLIVSVSGNVLQAYREKVTVYYVNTDDSGRAREIWRADQASLQPRTEQIRSALQEWLIGARTVYTDTRATKRAVEATYAMTFPDSAAYQTIASYHQANNPYTRARSETVEIEMQIPIQLSQDTWQLEWKETVKNSASGKIIETQKYQLTANILLASPKNEAQLLVNPVGLYVRQFSWPIRN